MNLSFKNRLNLKKMRYKIFFVAAFCIATLPVTQAQTQTPAINKEQREHQAKIRQGVNNGTLTPRETRKLERQQAHIQHDKKLAKADGVVAPAERKHIRKEQRRAERMIRREKRD
ncbi:MAG: hypothetical protein RLZZ292_4081 [Bacteroidota bacterium]|jgi:hypothetical protein